MSKLLVTLSNITIAAAVLCFTGCTVTGGGKAPVASAKLNSKQLVFSMELKGKATPVAGKENTLEANTTGIGQWGEVVTFNSKVVLDGSNFDEVGSINYQGHGKLAFKTVGVGHIGPSAIAGLSAGVVTWTITQGEGDFAGATGYITSNFTVSAKGDVVDNHYVRVFLK